MKRIVVVDESVAVRETLALILGREFVVVQRPPAPQQVLVDTEDQVDLLILGVSQPWTTESGMLLRSAAALPYAILFLVDSKLSWEMPIEHKANRIDYLAKPFNPYELKKKVGRLLANRRNLIPPASGFVSPVKPASRYLEYPYVSRATSLLAQRYARSKLPIFIYGEVGCGQDNVARAMYEIEAPTPSWVSVSCRALNVHDGVEKLLASRTGDYQQLAVFLHSVESLDPVAQSALLRLIEEEEEKGKTFWLISTARVDLLERVYHGEFLDALYYRLATLSLFLAPLRDRKEDIPELASRLAQECSERLGIGPVVFSQEAMARLCNYLWFGNIKELETVIARTVTAHGKVRLDAEDILFAAEWDFAPSLPARTQEEPVEAEQEYVAESTHEEKESGSTPSRNGRAVDLNLLVHELAHELKNPMVTIKTFAQLLGDRYDDPVFRNRFREMVSGDIERMDDLLENLLDFSRMGQPVKKNISLLEQLRLVLEDVLPESKRAWINEEFMNMHEDSEVMVDPEHLRYALKSVLRTALLEAKPKGEVDIHTEKDGMLVISYSQEGGRVVSLAEYLDPNARPTNADDEGMSLRVILAKILLEQNGGIVKLENDDMGKVRVRMELPVAEPRMRGV